MARMHRHKTLLKNLLACFAICLSLPAGAQSETTTAQNALKTALRTGDIASVTEALQAGAEPNPEGPISPLYIAARRGDVEIVEILIASGADLDATDPSGRTALVAALTRRNHDVVRTLIAAGADVNLAERSPGRGPLMLVIDEAPSSLSMTLLLEAGADINQPDGRGETPLAAAAFMGETEAAAVLIANGADVNVTNLQGVAPIEWARQRGNDEIVEMLIAAGATR